MDITYMTGIVLSITAMAGYGITNCVQRPLAEEISFRPKLVMYMGLIGAIILGILMLAQDAVPVLTQELIIKALLSSVSGFAALFFFLKSLSYGKVGVTVPVATAYAIVTPIILLILFGESIALSKMAAIAVVVSGIALIGVDPKQWDKKLFSNQKGAFIFALLALITWGTQIPLMQATAAASSPVFTAFAIELANMICAAIVLLFAREKFSLTFKTKSNYFLLLWSTILMIGALFSSVVAVDMISAATVAAIMSGSSVVSVILAFVLYKERMQKQQYFGIACVVIGLITVSLLK